MKTYTAFCADVDDDQSTVWIQAIEAKSVDDAVIVAARTCAADWECDPEYVHVLGIAEGNVNILYWEDR